jgi:hypothetical protein
MQAWLVRVAINSSTISRRSLFGRRELLLSTLAFAEIVYRRRRTYLRVGDGARVITLSTGSFRTTALREMQSVILGYAKAQSGVEISTSSPWILSQLISNFRARRRQ